MSVPRLGEKLALLALALLPLGWTARDAWTCLRLQEVPAALRSLEVERMALGGRNKADVAWPSFCYRWRGQQHCAARLYVSHNIRRAYMPFERDLKEVRRRAAQGTLTAWIDPAEPAFAVLVRRFDPLALVLHGLAFGVLAAWLFVRPSRWLFEQGRLVRIRAQRSGYDRWRDR